MRNYQKILLVTFFLLVITVPTIVMLFTGDKRVSLTEKRELTPRPDFVWSLEGIQDYPAEFEKYFNDHFGLRDFLVELNSTIMISLFKTSPKSWVILGKDNWLYIASEYVLQDFLGQHQIDQKTLKYWKQVLKEREEWLADRGSKYLFVVAPNKMSIYPEFLPERYQKRRGKDNFDQLFESLEKEPAFASTLNIRPLLLKAKRDNQLYFRGDTHWNHDGSYVAYNAIINYLQRWYPDLEPVPKSRMNYEEKKYSGDISFTLNMKRYFRETQIEISPPGKQRECSDYRGTEQTPSIYQSFRKGERCLYENSDKRLTAIFLSDSFGVALVNFLSQHFKRMIYIRGERFEDITDLIKQEKPDIVLDLTVARSMSVALSESHEVFDYMVEKRERRELPKYQISSGTVEQQLEEAVHARISSNPSGFTVYSSGADPQLIFSLSQGTSKGTLSVDCQMRSPADTDFKIYFQTEKEPFYSEQKSVSLPVKKGNNKVRLGIYDAILLDRVRIDPGKVPGRYQIKHIKFLSQEDGTG